MTKSDRLLILGIGGTPREGSSSERALATSLRAAEKHGAETVMIAGPELVLPMYNPGDSRRTPKAERLIELYRHCDGIVIASPAYHGSISGLMKNALDYCEDLRVGERVYFDGLPVGLIACAAGWQAGSQTLTALRAIVHALRGWPTPLGAALNTGSRLFDDCGECLDVSARLQLETVGHQVLAFSQMRPAMRSFAAIRGLM